MKNRFGKNGCYTCIICKKQTRDTGRDEAQFEMCYSCYEKETLSNEHRDGYHQDAVYHNCPICNGYGE